MGEANVIVDKKFDLPRELAVEAKGSSTTLKSRITVPLGFRWGPYKVDEHDGTDADDSLRSGDAKENYLQNITSHIPWIRILKLTNINEAANVEMKVDEKSKSISLTATSSITPGSELIARLTPADRDKSPTFQSKAKVCPNCSIRFSSSSTLKAHMTTYCTKRPMVNGTSNTPLHARKRLLPSTTLETTSVQIQPSTNTPMPTLTSDAPPPPTLPSSHPGPVGNEQQISSLGFCLQCGLFFANKELFEIHMKLDQQQQQSHAACYSAALVLAAPVVTKTGVHYVPIHPRIGLAADRRGAPTTTASPDRQASPSADLPMSDRYHDRQRHQKRMANGHVAAADVNEDTKPLDLRLPQTSLLRGLVTPPTQRETVMVECPECKIRMTPDKLFEHTTLCCSKSVDAQVAKITQLMRRPFLCTYCNTRFQSLNTFQAHQQFYCQGVRQQLRLANSPTNQLLVERPTTTPTSTTPTNTQTNKRRRLGALSKVSGVDCADFASSDPRSGSPSWCEVRDGYRCVHCGYLGQTIRGMKMHNRIHLVSGEENRRTNALPLETNGIRRKSGSPSYSQTRSNMAETKKRPQSAENLNNNNQNAPPVLDGMAVEKSSCTSCGIAYAVGGLEEFVHHHVECRGRAIKQEITTDS